MTQILERFNSVYTQFFDELRKEFHVKIDADDKTDHLTDFVKHILPYMDNISVCNEDFLKLTEPHLHLTHNVSFHHIMTHEKYEMNKISFWKYLHTIYLLSTKLEDEIKALSQDNIQIKAVISSKDDIVENIKKYKPETIFEIIAKPPTNANTAASTKADEIMEDLKEDDENEGVSDFFKSSMIGKLAEVLSKEFNPEEFKDIQNPMDLLGSLFQPSSGTTGIGPMPGMENILKKVCIKMDEKLKSGELNHEALLMDAQRLMSTMFSGPPGDANQFRQAGMMNMMNMMNMMPPLNNNNNNNNNNKQQPKVSKKNGGGKNGGGKNGSKK